MNLTLTQSKERADCLSGEIKAAYTALNECELAERDQERLHSIASQATERARNNLAALKTERDALADHAARLIRCKGETAPLADERTDAPRVGEIVTGDDPSVYGGFDASDDPGAITPYPNGESRLNQIFRSATEPQP